MELALFGTTLLFMTAVILVGYFMSPRDGTPRRAFGVGGFGTYYNAVRGVIRGLI